MQLCALLAVGDSCRVTIKYKGYCHSTNEIYNQSITQRRYPGWRVEHFAANDTIVWPTTCATITLPAKVWLPVLDSCPDSIGLHPIHVAERHVFVGISSDTVFASRTDSIMDNTLPGSMSNGRYFVFKNTPNGLGTVSFLPDSARNYWYVQQ